MSAEKAPAEIKMSIMAGMEKWAHGEKSAEYLALYGSFEGYGAHAETRWI